MRKPSNDDFEKFGEVFAAESRRAGKKQYLVPYFIASHPGQRSGRDDRSGRVPQAERLRSPTRCRTSFRRRWTWRRPCTTRGIDPFTKKPVHVARHLRDRKLQRALMQFFKPENYFEVREALVKAKRTT